MSIDVYLQIIDDNKPIERWWLGQSGTIQSIRDLNEKGRIKFIREISHMEKYTGNVNGGKDYKVTDAIEVNESDFKMYFAKINRYAGCNLSSKYDEETDEFEDLYTDVDSLVSGHYWIVIE